MNLERVDTTTINPIKSASLDIKRLQPMVYRSGDNSDVGGVLLQFEGYDLLF